MAVFKWTVCIPLKKVTRKQRAERCPCNVCSHFCISTTAFCFFIDQLLCSLFYQPSQQHSLKDRGALCCFTSAHLPMPALSTGRTANLCQLLLEQLRNSDFLKKIKPRAVGKLVSKERPISKIKSFILQSTGDQVYAAV